MTEQYRTIGPEIQEFYRTGGHFTGLVRQSDGISFSLM
jgi:hypothetical protein